MPIPIDEVRISQAGFTGRNKNQYKIINLLKVDPKMAYTMKEIQSICSIRWPAAAHTALDSLEKKNLIEGFMYEGLKYHHWIGPGGQKIMVENRAEFVGGPDIANLQEELREHEFEKMEKERSKVRKETEIVDEDIEYDPDFDEDALQLGESD